MPLDDERDTVREETAERSRSSSRADAESSAGSNRFGTRGDLRSLASASSEPHSHVRSAASSRSVGTLRLNTGLSEAVVRTSSMIGSPLIRMINLCNK